jgi:hypothetical protein
VPTQSSSCEHQRQVGSVTSRHVGEAPCAPATKSRLEFGAPAEDGPGRPAGVTARDVQPGGQSASVSTQLSDRMLMGPVVVGRSRSPWSGQYNPQPCHTHDRSHQFDGAVHHQLWPTQARWFVFMPSTRRRGASPSVSRGSPSVTRLPQGNGYDGSVPAPVMVARAGSGGRHNRRLMSVRLSMADLRCSRSSPGWSFALSTRMTL